MESLRILKETIRSPEVIHFGAGVLGVVGVNLAPSINYGSYTGDITAVAVDCAAEQFRRTKRAAELFGAWRMQRHAYLESRAAAGIVSHGLLRRVYDYLSTLNSDDMACRVTRRDLALHDYIFEETKQLAS